MWIFFLFSINAYYITTGSMVAYMSNLELWQTTAYSGIFNCRGVGTPNSSTVQWSTVYLDVGLLEYMVALFLIAWGISILLSIVTIPIYFIINNAQEAESLLTRVNFCLLYDSHSNWPEVITHYSTDFNSIDY